MLIRRQRMELRRTRMERILLSIVRRNRENRGELGVRTRKRGKWVEDRDDEKDNGSTETE